MLFGGRIRTSTVALLAAFLVILAVYVLLRPAPAT